MTDPWRQSIAVVANKQVCGQVLRQQRNVFRCPSRLLLAKIAAHKARTHVLHTYIRMTGRRSSSSNDCQQQKQQKRQMQQGGAAETFMFDATRRIFQLRPSRQGGGVSDTIPSPKRHPNSYIKPNTGDGRGISPPLKTEHRGR